MIRAAVIGFGNVGKCVYDALISSRDMQFVCVVESPAVKPVPELADRWVTELGGIRGFGGADVAILALPSRMCPDAADELLDMGINTADAFDVHQEIWDVKRRLDATAKRRGVSGIISAGWDPGTDSIIRVLFEAMAPNGITYTNFGPGMSMGHTVTVKAMPGVKNALSMTIPAGSGVHRRMVYVELNDGADFNEISGRIKSDPSFVHDETHVIATDDIGALMNMGHSVELTRGGVSGKTHNQLFSYVMKINNPALTGQVLVSAARASVRQPPGCYTLAEIPAIDMLPGEREDLIRRLI